LLGKRIAEEDLAGGNSENYGNAVIKNLSEELADSYGKGFSPRNLYNFIQFYKAFPEMLQALTAKSPMLTWTHYCALLRVCDDGAREWYAKESLDQMWSARVLERNISTQYYHRLLKTSDKQAVGNEMRKKTSEHGDRMLEFIKNPIVAEFLGLSPNTDFTESNLEESILNNLQKFLMEMGKGYAFVARQQHIRTETGDFYIDLVFYNYHLKCFVLLDLKIGKLTHQDIGQIDMYVRMYDELKMNDGDNPTIGIVLCSETDADVVHYSVLNDKDQLFAAKYLTCLPSKESLRAEIEAQKAIYFSEHPGDRKRLE
jgi:predicted nuclease of restriction endonuclease-like (RecB) superfamily